MVNKATKGLLGLAAGIMAGAAALYQPTPAQHEESWLRTSQEHSLEALTQGAADVQVQWREFDDRFVTPYGGGMAFFKEPLPRATQEEHLQRAYTAEPGEPVIASAPILFGGLMYAMDAADNTVLPDTSRQVADRMLDHYGSELSLVRLTGTKALHAEGRSFAVITDYPGAPADFALKALDRNMPLGPDTLIAPTRPGRTVSTDAKHVLSALTGVDDPQQFNDLTQRLTGKDAQVWRLGNPYDTERAVWVGGYFDLYFGVGAVGYVGRGPALGVARER